MLGHFKEYNEKNAIRFDEFQVTVMQGNKKDGFEREDFGTSLVIYDELRPKVIKRPNPLVVLQGSVKITQYFDNIEKEDIERYKQLNSLDKINYAVEESTVEDAVSKGKLERSYTFDAHYDELSAIPSWRLETYSQFEATSDDTRLLCTNALVDQYTLKALDIPVNNTKTLEKINGKNFIFFSQPCSVNGVEIKQYSLKELTSDTLEITNLGVIPARIIIIQR